MQSRDRPANRIRLRSEFDQRQCRRLSRAIATLTRLKMSRPKKRSAHRRSDAEHCGAHRGTQGCARARVEQAAFVHQIHWSPVAEQCPARCWKPRSDDPSSNSGVWQIPIQQLQLSHSNVAQLRDFHVRHEHERHSLHAPERRPRSMHRDGNSTPVGRASTLQKR